MPFLRRRYLRPGRQSGRRAFFLLASLSILAFWSLSRQPLWANTPYIRTTEYSQEVKQGSFSAGVSCIAWRKTDHCSPFGKRIPEQDSDCQTWISQGSGYCQCSARRTVKRLPCGRHARFRCEDECRRVKTEPLISQSLPFNSTCSRGVALLAHQSLRGLERLSLDGWDDLASSLWSQIVGAVDGAGRSTVHLPEIRSEVQDWVRDGLRLPRGDMERARAEWQRFRLEAPDYPQHAFQGSGIAILAGGPQYMVPAWVNVKMLRKSGCQLPVEMLFPAAEYPTEELVAALAELGVTCRILPNVVVQSSRKGQPSDIGAEPFVDPMSGFTLKIAAVILSSFQEVIFLDSDNVAVDDVGVLFNSQHYRDTGAMLWPDYWASSAAPDMRDILGLKSLPEGTSESGQMVFDKMRVWDALVLAAYFNMNSGFYYEMFSNFMGKGDKESFSFAFAATKTPYYMIPHPVGSLGVMRNYCSPDQSFCWEEFTGNTMTQYSPKGKLLFLHTNLSPKWNLMVPGDFKAYTRRWQVLVPGSQRLSELEAEWGRDVEFDIWQSIADFRCAGFFRQYMEEYTRLDARLGRHRMLGVHGFHPQNEGVNFRQAYRWGLTGRYLDFTQVNLGDTLQHIKNTRIKPIGAWYRRALMRLIKRDTYFRFW